MLLGNAHGFIDRPFWRVHGKELGQLLGALLFEFHRLPSVGISPGFNYISSRLFADLSRFIEKLFLILENKWVFLHTPGPIRGDVVIHHIETLHRPSIHFIGLFRRLLIGLPWNLLVISQVCCQAPGCLQ